MATATEKIYSIGDFAKAVGLTAPTLRYYENEGLIEPHRHANGRRYYEESDVNWVKFLLHLKGTGMSISELKQYVVWRAEGDATIPQRLELLKQVKADFLVQFNEVQHHLQILNDKINWYEEKETGITTDNENFASYLQRFGHHE
ncbi:MerR family transcriptional regulator [Lactiplantibacillus fabifermentans]|uniref:Transcription regulator n=2 Tax=Lactiplantibacillus fabifermentans TaxID=483011 RepID=A0A0R2NV20_9LACO|nr:MerR family transcriptional regulator [Lactiplantibacillus fabifermentans]ETY73365.1 MerR family transcriptional regulator [Lactiplantibacillus fabifermentans T30PCM01]KRO29609.1 transcription regulator [Lactiplantibacillus fabifermentans DSM 21115]